MGKSPAKWIKGVLFGKKTSKSNLTTGRERNAKEKVLIAAESPETNFAVDPTIPTHATSTPNTIYRNERNDELNNREALVISQDREIPLPGKEDTAAQKYALQVEPDDTEGIRREQAAIKAQAAFKGYLARRAFRALKGILRLQALFRGHLVRRQAVATLCSMLGIVRIQAHARGIRIRYSAVGYEVHKKCSQAKAQNTNLIDQDGVTMSMRMAKMSTNVFISKLLASSPVVMPLRVHYDSGEPNSVLCWLERWSASHVWKPAPRPKKSHNSKSQKKLANGQLLETETGRPKRSMRRIPAANLDNVSVQTTPEFEKPKLNLRKVSNQAPVPVQENPQIELEKVKRNLRKIHNPTVDISVPPEAETEKPKQSLEKASIVPDIVVFEKSTNISTMSTKKDTVMTEPKLPDPETTLKLVVSNEVISLQPGGDQGDTEEAKPRENNTEEAKSKKNNGNDEDVPEINGDTSHKEDFVNNENNRSSRKTPVLLKQERAENGMQSSQNLPSYMMATESAKAKLRLQGYAKLSPDGSDKNNLTRRHSLPSSTNAKINSQSPRTQRVVHSGGKGGNKNDRSMLSSRERDTNNAKCTLPDWRR